MKKLLLYIYTVLFLSAVCGYAQNLVPNPSFEQHTQCPNSTGQVSYTGNWYWAGATTDYYDSCSPQGNMSVPLNIYGYQDAFEGTAYIGMNVYAIHEGASVFYVREPTQSALIQALNIGTKYYVSFKVALTLNNFESCCATNKLGARFTTFPYTDANGNSPAPIDNFAHIYSDSIVTDTVNWTTISGSFIADSAYAYITLGNFFDSTQLQVIDYFGNFPQTSASYYYVDDIKVSTDSVFVNHIKETGKADKCFFYPNPTEGIIKIRTPYRTKITVYNSIGELIKKYLVGSYDSIDLSSLPNGIYYLKFEHDNTNITKPLIINSHD